MFVIATENSWYDIYENSEVDNGMTEFDTHEEAQEEINSLINNAIDDNERAYFSTFYVEEWD